MLFHSLAALALALSVSAQASTLDLDIVDQQYLNSGFNSISDTGFGVSLNATALLEVQYSFGTVQNGAPYTVADVTDAPDIFVTPTAETASSFTTSTLYTLILADAASLGDPDVQGNYRHFLGNSFNGSVPTSGNLTFQPENGVVITAYASPGPIAGTGPHRYAWLLFTQPSDFTAPANLSTPGTASGHWSVASYVQETNIQLVAASFFTVENGTPTGSVVATSAVDTAALASSLSATSTSKAASSSSKAASSTKSGSSSSSSSAPASTSTPGAANKVSTGSALVGLACAGVAGLLF